MRERVGVSVVGTHESLDGHQATRRLEPHRSGHRLLVIKQEPIFPAPRMQVKLDPHTKEELIGLDQRLIVLRLDMTVEENLSLGVLGLSAQA